MAAVEQLTFAEFEARLKPYGCTRVQAYRGPMEVWLTGWDEVFTVYCDDGTYDPWIVDELVQRVFPLTIPPDWKP
jgi:hypothetical protein